MPNTGDTGKKESGVKRPCAKAGKKARANKKTAGAPRKPATTKAKKPRTTRKTNGQAAPAAVYALDQVPDRANNTATHSVSVRQIPG